MKNKVIIVAVVCCMCFTGCTQTSVQQSNEQVSNIESSVVTESGVVVDGSNAAEMEEVADVHEWENIDYTAEGTIEESGRTLNEEIPFRDYALKVIGVDSVVQYFEENSECFAQFVQDGTSYSANVACIHGDFDNDGDMEYLVATNYGHSMRNDVAIVDNGEVVFWADDECANNFYKVRVGEYFKADPDKLTGGVLEDYIKYTFVDYKVNSDNMFIGVRDSEREAYNYYYQIAYDETDGYSIKLLKRIGWETNFGEDENGNIIGRQFIEETF